jgi:hypothetical protein
MKRNNLLKRKPAVRQNKHPPARAKLVAVRSTSGLTHPVRGSLGRALADELADR